VCGQSPIGTSLAMRATSSGSMPGLGG